MTTLTINEWTRYRDLLAKLSNRAAEEFRDAVWNSNGFFKGVGLKAIPRADLIEYAYALVAKYSEGAAEAACEFYDALAELSGAVVPLAEPAPIPEISTVAKAINGTIMTENEELISAALGRLVKQTGQDTTLQNAMRDNAQVAWIPAGDTCAFCITLASRGWRDANEDMLDKGHAKHIHSNCDCAYAVKFNDDTKYSGYDPEKYKKMYYGAPLDGQRPSGKNRINAMRREIYEENKDRINAQKRSAYERRKKLNSTKAEEADV